MAMSHQEKIDRQLDAEQAVVGSMLVDERVVRDVIARVDPADFQHPTNRLDLPGGQVPVPGRQAGGRCDYPG